jgi:hypothetical protein
MNTFGQKNLIFKNGEKSAISAKILIRTTANFCPNLGNEFKVGYFYFNVKKKSSPDFVFQSLTVPLMEHVQVKALAMIQQEPVFAMKDIKE